MTVYRFKPEVFNNIKSSIGIGCEELSEFFKISDDSFYEFPQIEVYLCKESSTGGKKYRKTSTHLEPDYGPPLDFRKPSDIAKVGDVITINDYNKFEEIQENIIIEEAKTRLTDTKYYAE